MEEHLFSRWKFLHLQLELLLTVEFFAYCPFRCSDTIVSKTVANASARASIVSQKLPLQAQKLAETGVSKEALDCKRRASNCKQSKLRPQPKNLSQPQNNT